MTTAETRKFLEACGLHFARIPAGRYRVGYDARRRRPLLARSPQSTLGGQPAATPTRAQWVQAKKFLITTEPLRLSHWEKLAVAMTLPVSLDDIAIDLQRQQMPPTAVIEPRASLRQASGLLKDKTVLEPRTVQRQVETDPVIELPFQSALAVAQTVGAALPRWEEWEIATRGPQGFLYPWGNDLDVKQLTLELQDYSIDTESEMGFYCCDQDVYFFHSFGAYQTQPSPFGLGGLARCGREWNLCHAGQPLAEEDHLLRSICDLGAMAGMHPGVNPRLWDSNRWRRERETFSGPVLPCYASEKVAGGLYSRAGFRFVLH